MTYNPHNFQTGYITQSTYPIFMPYRKSSKNKTNLAGCTPRKLVIMFSTLVNTHDSAWDANTRTLSLTHGYSVLAKRFRLYDGGISRAQTNATLRELALSPCLASDGTSVPICEKINLDADVDDRTITFSTQYVKMLTDNPIAFPLAPLLDPSQPALTYDLVTLACCYGRPDRRVIIPLPVLRVLLPSNESLNRYTLTNRVINAANRSQKEWCFRVNKKSISIAPAEKYAPWANSVILDMYERNPIYKVCGTDINTAPQFLGSNKTALQTRSSDTQLVENR